MAVAILLSACSDDTDRLSDKWDFLQIAAYTQDMVSPSDSAATRAVTGPSGYSEYNGSASIGVFMTPSTTEMTLISYEDNAWHSMVKVSSGTDYYIYGYMPAYVTCTIAPNTSYPDGAILTFTDVPSVMSEDFSVITGVFDHEGSATTSGTLKAGTFAYTGRASGENFVSLMFDHLYGALNVSFKVDADYYALRTIKLKELKLRTNTADGPSKSEITVTVTLKKTEDGTSPIPEEGGVVFESTGNDMVDEPFFQSATGVELKSTESTEPSSFMGHFMPQGITSFVLTSVYDVYDKNNNLIRQDCTAENKLIIRELFDGQTVTKRGTKYTVNMIIKPTFLYMLSEPDLDNPTVEVN